MPTYEYECRDCGHRFEKFQAMSAKPVKKCPECGGRARRMIGAGAAVIVRGGSTSRRQNPPLPCGRDESCKSCPYEQ